MRALLLIGASALSLAACANFTAEQTACVITGLTASDMAELDLALAQKIAADCGVTVQSVIEAVNDAASK
jgi:hypothetical protein